MRCASSAGTKVLVPRKPVGPLPVTTLPGTCLRNAVPGLVAFWCRELTSIWSHRGCLPNCSPLRELLVHHGMASHRTEKAKWE